MLKVSIIVRLDVHGSVSDGRKRTLGDSYRLCECESEGKCLGTWCRG